uniref:Uncharacterized protein n=1 Tax=Glossina brevipalpis TaxID=37001 RepID=A0A1A9X3B5_9MUSC
MPFSFVLHVSPECWLEHMACAFSQRKQELRLRRVHQKTLKKAKLQLTQNLINRSMKSVKELSFEDLETVFQEMLYSENLEYEIELIKEMEQNIIIKSHVSK